MWDSSVSRRAVLAGSAGVAASFVSGCITTSATPPGQDRQQGAGQSDTLLKTGGSSTVYPIVKLAASHWNGNYPASDLEYWGPTQYDITTDKRLANYWASYYGLDKDDQRTPPFNVSVSLSHSGTGLENLKAGRISIGNASASVSAEFPEMSQEELDKFENHVVGVDAQPIVVSEEIYESGVTRLSAEQLKQIYTGEIDDWRQIDGYSGESKSIQAIGRTPGSGTDTSFRKNLFGDPDTPIPGADQRKGQNQQVKNIISNSDNAIGYMALGFVDDSIETLTLAFDGKEFVPGENLSDPDYPLSRDLHCYTYDGTSKTEAAFLRMIISDFGQEKFVRASNYSALTDERQQNQMDALPDPVQ
ncbi:PstS family phosphate ABC transporter substrate-binding protein [Halapricum desulfuricans]|uniref:PstS family phosphate ABC transporter substrate-binding protein n=1 Tax=Halapricum desulfuricans TaxID=2841257 RepID=UPI003AB9394B